MSGRLIILPKKSYCPWNPENLERVRRDEEQHAASVASKLEHEQNVQSKERMKRLKGKEPRNDSEGLQSCHVNLFAAEEEEERKAKRRGTRGASNDQLSRGHQRSRGPDSPHSRRERKRKEERRKRQLDPMSAFASTETNPVNDNVDMGPKESHQYDSSSRKRRHTYRAVSKTLSGSPEPLNERKSKRRRRERSMERSNKRGRTSRSKRRESNTSKDSMEELRRRRAAREGRERHREDTIRGRFDESCNTKYHNQYNPEISRR